MSERLISRSHDLKRLQDEGYDLVIAHGHLLVQHIPYVTTDRDVAYGTLVCPLTLSGDVTTRPDSHVIYFIGAAPCDRDGRPLSKVINSPQHQQLTPELAVDYMFSSKPVEGYPDHYAKVTTYVAMIMAHARALDETVTATTFPVVTPGDEDASVFQYLDTASSRAGISAITAKLAATSVAIVGLGGTGSYILDLVAKTPVRAIHLYDDDLFLQHNAFRAPGAASVADLEKRSPKVIYLSTLYSRLYRQLIPHPYRIDDRTVAELRAVDFVFVALDNGPARKLVVHYLLGMGIPFIDVGMGIDEADGCLAGIVRVTKGTAAKSDHIMTHDRIPFANNDDDGLYTQNIQIADLNALNAALAVIMWKKHWGFYQDLEGEHSCCYTVNGNHLVNADRQ